MPKNRKTPTVKPSPTYAQTLSALSRPELNKLAKECGITGAYQMPKGYLIGLLANR